MNKTLALAIIIAMGILMPQARAATITQVADNGGGNSPEMNTGSTWTGGAVPTGANNYISATGFETAAAPAVGLPTVTGTLRAGGLTSADGFGASGGTETFSGNSLTIAGHTRFLLRNGTTHNTSGDTVIVNNLTLNDQSVVQWAVGVSTGISAYLGGSMQIAAGGNAYVDNATGTGAILNLSSSLTGSGTLNMYNSVSTEHINLTGNLSAFTGNLTYMSVGTFGIANASALVLANTTLTFTTGASGSVFTLGNNLDVSHLSINGVSIANGTYTGSALDSAAGVSTFNGMSSLITVGPVPEPGTGAMLFGGLGALAMGIRRMTARK